MYDSSKPTITSGVDKRVGTDGRPYSVTYISIDGYDPMPGSRGYYCTWESPYQHNGTSVTGVTAKRWRKRAAKDIRKLAKRLRAPAGTDFHQLIRLHQGLQPTVEPYEPRSPDLEDRRRVAEFEWELRQSWLVYPATVADLLKRHHHNRAEIEALRSA